MQLDSEYKTFSASCIYPDHPRIRAAEHFLDLPRDSKGLTSDECPLADACVLTAILHDFKILQAKEQTDASKLVALKSLGHWVGDIHHAGQQPGPLPPTMFRPRPEKPGQQCPDHDHRQAGHK